MTIRALLIVFGLLLFQSISAQPDRKFVAILSGSELFEQTKDSLRNLKLTGHTYNGLALSSLYDSIQDRVIFSDALVIYDNNLDTIAFMKYYIDTLNFLYTNGYTGFIPSQSTLFLPKNGREYYYIYTTMSDSGAIKNYAYDQFDYIIINMDSNGGKGGVRGFRHPLLREPVQSGHVTATRHANGRDWWLLQKGRLDSIYSIFLVTPDTITLLHKQYIGKNSQDEVDGYSFFSHQGDKLVYTDIRQQTQIFEFDRCTGKLSNAKYIHSKWYDWSGILVSPDTIPGMLGCVFSPSGRYLYLNNYYAIFQFDLLSANIDSSGILIAKRDSSYLNVSREVFDNGLLMKNNKIYYDNWSASGPPGSFGALHVINYPDSPGVKCGFVHDEFKLLTLGMSFFPNMPSYRPGVLVGSGCDTIVATGVQDIPQGYEALSLYPNPATHDCHLRLSLPAAAVVDVTLLDMTGRVVQSITHRHYDSGTVDVTFRTGGYAAGMYLVQVSDGVQVVNRKLSIAEE